MYVAGGTPVYSPQCGLCPFHRKMALLTYVQLVIHCHSRTFLCRTVIDRAVIHSVDILNYILFYRPRPCEFLKFALDSNPVL